MAAKKPKPKMAFNVANFTPAVEDAPVPQKLTVVPAAATPAVAAGIESFLSQKTTAETSDVAIEPGADKSTDGAVQFNVADKSLSISEELSADDLKMLKKGFPIRLSKLQISRLSQVFAESKFKSKQKMAEALLMAGVERLAKEMGI